MFDLGSVQFQIVWCKRSNEKGRRSANERRGGRDARRGGCSVNRENKCQEKGIGVVMRSWSGGKGSELWEVKSERRTRGTEGGKEGERRKMRMVRKG